MKNTHPLQLEQAWKPSNRTHRLGNWGWRGFREVPRFIELKSGVQTAVYSAPSHTLVHTRFWSTNVSSIYFFPFSVGWPTTNESDSKSPTKAGKKGGIELMLQDKPPWADGKEGPLLQSWHPLSAACEPSTLLLLPRQHMLGISWKQAP